MSLPFQSVETAKAKTTKKDKKSEEPSSVASDPLSSGSVDPLSLPPSSDPLSAALLDPLSQAAAEATGSKAFGAKPEKVQTCIMCVTIFCIALTEFWLSCQNELCSLLLCQLRHDLSMLDLQPPGIELNYCSLCRR